MSTSIWNLQQEQFSHDQRCHRDILYLSYQERFKHIAMHYGKYSGRLAEILKGKSIGISEEEIIKKTLVDSFIIVLNSAELLQVNLDSLLKQKLGIQRMSHYWNCLIFLRSPHLNSMMPSIRRHNMKKYSACCWN